MVLVLETLRHKKLPIFCGRVRNSDLTWEKILLSMFLHSMTENLFNDPRVWSVQSLTNILWALATLREQGLGEVYTLPTVYSN